MDLAARLRALADALPPHGSVTFSRDDLVAMVSECGEGNGAEPNPGRDLTVGEVAERMKRHPNTVRDWCRDGRLRSYKLQGRDLRIPPAALAEFIQAQQHPTMPARRPGTKADLGSWRKIRNAG